MSRILIGFAYQCHAFMYLNVIIYKSFLLWKFSKYHISQLGPSIEKFILLPGRNITACKVFDKMSNTNWNFPFKLPRDITPSPPQTPMFPGRGRPQDMGLDRGRPPAASPPPPIRRGNQGDVGDIKTSLRRLGDAQASLEHLEDVQEFPGLGIPKSAFFFKFLFFYWFLWRLWRS